MEKSAKTRSLFYGKIKIFYVKSTVLLNKLLKSWFHGNFWEWSRFIILFHAVASMLSKLHEICFHEKYLKLELNYRFFTLKFREINVFINRLHFNLFSRNIYQMTVSFFKLLPSSLPQYKIFIVCRHCNFHWLSKLSNPDVTNFQLFKKDELGWTPWPENTLD